ncbi:MAG: hypothetical protein ACE5H8_05980 [Alphaproteobacteria bacterium]
MYAFLAKHLPRPLANALVGAWYAVLLCLVLYFAGTPQATFRYTQL